MLTRAASKSKVLLRQYYNGPNDHQLSPRTTIRSIPNEVLLEIFDSFRQSFQLEPFYERAWNSNKGWFKLAHVCQEWRRLVLTSPSRLHVRLLFTEHRSARAIAIRRLPPLPIIVDFRHGVWFGQTQNRMISALSYPDRVCGVSFNTSHKRSKHTWKMFGAMRQPFPSLKSLELRSPGPLELPVPPPFLLEETPHLQSLKFIGNVTRLSRLLPYTTSLVCLTLGLDSTTFSSRDTQLLVHLQALSSLRHLKVATNDADMLVHPPASEDVLLPTLTSLSFAGSMQLLEPLMAGLTAPSLQGLHISVFPRSILPPTHLTSFIRKSGRRIFSAQLYTLGRELNLFMSTHSHSTDDPPFEIFATGICSTQLIGDLFSEILATVEDVFFASPFCFKILYGSAIKDTFPSNTFFAPFRSARIIRVSPGIESEVEEMFRNERPEEQSPDLLPALEEIEFNATTASRIPIRIDKEVASVLEPFQPFVDARRRAGHPVKVHWNTDRVLPGYFCDTEMLARHDIYISRFGPRFWSSRSIEDGMQQLNTGIVG